MPTMPLEGRSQTLRGDQGNAVHLTERPLCGNCQKKEPVGEERYKACQRCMFIRYCSRDCQKAHWKSHKKVCKNITKIVQNKESGSHSIDKMMKVKKDTAVKHQSQATLRKAIKAARAPWYTILSHDCSPSTGDGDVTNDSIIKDRLEYFMSKVYLFSSGFLCKNFSLNRGKGCLFIYTNVSWDNLTMVSSSSSSSSAGKKSNSNRSKGGGSRNGHHQISLAWGWDSLKTIRQMGGLYAGGLLSMLPYKVDEEMIQSKIGKSSPTGSFLLVVLCDPTSEYVLANVRENLQERNGRFQDGVITQLVIECRILDPAASDRYAQRMPETEILCFNFGS